MDSYQAIYDAVRSRIHSVDVSGAFRAALDFDAAIVCAREAFSDTGLAMTRPSVLYRPAIMIDGNKWCALYGENLQDGVAGFGDSPYEAMSDFDKAWTTKLQKGGAS